MYNIVVLCREYPLPGGRMTMIRNLVNHTKHKYTILSWNTCIKRSSLLMYHLQCFLYLLKRRNDFDIIWGAGLSATSGMIFARLFNKPGIFNLSGVRTVRHIPSINAMLERIAAYFADVVTVPSLYCKEAVLKDIKTDKIEVINESSNI